MQQIVNFPSNPHISTCSNNDTIFYNFVGNFVPPEWCNLTSNNNKPLSKTARQLLSLIVFRLQVCHNDNMDELQESYHFFEQSLGVCQRRIRQCMLELQEGGFIDLHNATVVKQHVKCRNTPCIKLAKNFRPYPKKFSHESEKSFSSTRKKFQPHNIIDINNKSNISRSSESDFLKSSVDRNTQEKKQSQEQLAKQAAELTLQAEELPVEKVQPEIAISKTVELVENTAITATPLAIKLMSVMQKISDSNTNEIITSPNSNSQVADSNKGWFKRKKLADFHPLTEEDADLLQLRSNREFNLGFINQLLLKLAEQYPDHHFCNKKVVMNYMTKALIHELRESSKVNCSNFRFKSNDPDKLKSQYLEKIECATSTSKQAQLKRKIAGSFEQDTAYELLTLCEFIKVASDQYQVKLLKDISLSEHMKTKILEQVQAVYGSKINQLQIIPFTQSIVQKQEDKSEDNQTYLSELNKLDPASVWYKVRRSLLQQYGKQMDRSIFSKLVVIEEDKVTNQVILKPITPFIDYLVRQRYMGYLRLAFQAQNFTFKLLEADKENKLMEL